MNPFKLNRFAWLLLYVCLLSACGAEPTAPSTPSVIVNLPEILAVELDRPELPRYESLELSLVVEATYENPYDARQVRLEGFFTAPDGSQVQIPGFWDGETAWRLRFTPWQAGNWAYRLVLTDSNGASLPAEGVFQVSASDLRGWLQVGNQVNPDYSAHYLVYHDGTPFYGVGHCDALNILIDGFDINTGVRLFDNMRAAQENYVVWWPMYSNSIVNTSYADYSVSNMNLIDLVVKDAQAKGIFLIFTVWDHPQLRDASHSWGDGRWAGYNGFSNLTELNGFFTEDESWAWQENLYRYLIARWGYSPALGMWQTVSEINGTNAYQHTDRWHQRVNDYFVANDPYRHPTTASMSGDVNWPGGFAVMDVPQVHVYDLDDVVGAAESLAYWTELMWQTAKPNWVGEFGVPGNSSYPELFHNSIWAALAAGAAMTPAEWNSGGSWMQMTTAMYADQARLAQFVSEIPLAAWNPQALAISSLDPQVRAWGLGSAAGGLIWAQDFALQGQPVSVIREDSTVRVGVQLEIAGLPAGRYRVHPYDTWQGVFLEAFDLQCPASGSCLLALPDFHADLALKIVGTQ